MDGVEPLAQILLIGATNRLDLIDGALLRPGRFDERLHVPLPDQAGRLEVLEIHTRSMSLARDVDLGQIAERCDGWSGAQISALCREGARHALREDVDAEVVDAHHIEHAFSIVH